MTLRQFALFATGLVLPAMYQRLKFALNRPSFYRTELRRKSGLNIHHGHWGLAMLVASTFMLVFGYRDWTSIGLAGFGLGLILDEIIPAFRMPSDDRDLELRVYSDSRNATFLLIAIALAASAALYLSIGR